MDLNMLKETNEYELKVGLNNEALHLKVEPKLQSYSLSTTLTNQNMEKELKDVFVNFQNIYTYIQDQNNYLIDLKQKQIVVIVYLSLPFSNAKKTEHIKIKLNQKNKSYHLHQQSDILSLQKLIQTLQTDITNIKNQIGPAKPISIQTLNHKILEERNFIIKEINKFIVLNNDRIVQTVQDKIAVQINKKIPKQTNISEVMQLKYEDLSQNFKKLERKLQKDLKQIRETFENGVKIEGSLPRKLFKIENSQQKEVNIFEFNRRQLHSDPYSYASTSLNQGKSDKLMYPQFKIFSKYFKKEGNMITFTGQSFSDNFSRLLFENQIPSSKQVCYRFKPKTSCDIGVIDCRFYEQSRKKFQNYIYLSHDGEVIDGSRTISKKFQNFKEGKTIVMKVHKAQLKITWIMNDQELTYISNQLSKKDVTWVPYLKFIQNSDQVQTSI